MGRGSSGTWLRRERGRGPAAGRPGCFCGRRRSSSSGRRRRKRRKSFVAAAAAKRGRAGGRSEETDPQERSKGKPSVPRPGKEDCHCVQLMIRRTLQSGRVAEGACEDVNKVQKASQMKQLQELEL